MNPADLINGGIQFVIALFFLLVALGVVPIGKTQEARESNRQKYGWFWWLGFLVLTIMAIAKTFGVMS